MTAATTERLGPTPPGAEQAVAGRERNQGDNLARGEVPARSPSYIQSPLIAVVRPDICAVDGCGRPWHCRDWCRKHYTTWRRHGSPTGTARPLVCATCGRRRVLSEICSKCQARTDREIDPVAVERALRGEADVDLTKTEIRHVIPLMTENGMSAKRIAEVLGVTPRTVVRWRARNREAA